MMGDCTSGGLLFSWVCLVLLSSVESLTWTEQPTNPTVVVEGQDVSLTWRYTLTAQELAKSQSFFFVKWEKFNDSSSSFDDIASRLKFPALGSNPLFDEKLAPHIVVDRATGTDFASLKINDVVITDEGLYKIIISVESGINAVEEELNLTVLVPPEIVTVSDHQDICEGSLVTLSCNATGIPTPSITWTRVADNGSDSAPLPAVDGTYVMSNITRSLNGTYRCTARSGAGTVDRTVLVTVRYPPSVDRIVNSSNSVIEGHPFNMTCEASGDPIPKNYTWIANNTGLRHYGSILALPNINRSDTGQYRCEADNRCGSGSRVQSIDVLYQPRITSISGNKTVNDTMTVTLNCTREGNPFPNISWTRVSDNSPVNMPFTIIGKQAQGCYRCTANNGIGRSDSKDACIIVENHRPTNTSLATDLVGNITVVNTSFNLICSAQAKPAASYRLYKGQESLTNTASGSYPTSVNTRVKQVTYRCTPFNYYGEGPTEEITVKVHYAPFVTDYDQTITVTSGTPTNLPCPVEGYPEPNITWYKGDDISGRYLRTGKDFSLTPTKSDAGWYTCFANNSLGNITASLNLVVEPDTTGPTDRKAQFFAKVTVITENGMPVKFILEYKDLNSAASKKFVDKFVEEFLKACGPICRDIEVLIISPGSVIVSFVVNFTRPLTTDEGLAELRGAVNNGSIGPFKVTDLTVVDPPPTTTPEEKTTQKPTSADGTPWAIIGGVAGGVVVLVIFVAVLTWCVHKKRKCRKDTKIGHSESEAQVLQEGAVDDNAYSQVNHGYARSGPPSANDVDRAARQEAAVAVPTYAVVDKSKKKKNQKEEKPPEYATVDKSKKKKKKDEKEDYTYAEVDMSKKSSKKQQPKNTDGVVYADLGDFQRPQMPPVSTSPAALPPVKRPPSYEGTQYADITEFLKGDAALPKKRNSQGMEMQPQASAPATGSSQGNEVKPQGANKDETGVPPKESKL